jgi:hypothetical protein
MRLIGAAPTSLPQRALRDVDGDQLGAALR